jgi:hypothetical protein
MLLYLVFNYLESKNLKIFACLYLSCSLKANHPNIQLDNNFFFHFSFIIHMCIQALVHFSPLPPPPPLPPTPPPPSPPTQYPAETILPLSLILL